MQVVLLRHGAAQARSPDTSAALDAARRLTEEGRRRVRSGAAGLLRLVPRFDALASSPLARAAETAELTSACYGGPKPAVLTALEPAGPREEVAGWLAAQRADSAVLLVGHSPDLEQLAGWLLCGSAIPFLRLTRGGACLLNIEQSPGPACAELRWSIPARSLRQLGAS